MAIHYRTQEAGKIREKLSKSDPCSSVGRWMTVNQRITGASHAAGVISKARASALTQSARSFNKLSIRTRVTTDSTLEIRACGEV